MIMITVLEQKKNIKGLELSCIAFQICMMIGLDKLFAYYWLKISDVINNQALRECMQKVPSGGW